MTADETSVDDLVLCGVLTKRGSCFPYTWRARHFRLYASGNVLMYFESELAAASGEQPRGTAILKGIRRYDIVPHGLVFDLQGGSGRPYEMLTRAPSEEERQRWYNTFNLPVTPAPRTRTNTYVDGAAPAVHTASALQASRVSTLEEPTRMSMEDRMSSLHDASDAMLLAELELRRIKLHDSVSLDTVRTKYLIGKKLGVGASASVYEVTRRDGLLTKPLAVKVRITYYSNCDGYNACRYARRQGAPAALEPEPKP